jgi:hypothetical protein
METPIPPKPLKGFGGAGVLEVVEGHDGNTYFPLLVRPDGQFNDRAWAPQQITEALGELVGEAWSKVRGRSYPA